MRVRFSTIAWLVIGLAACSEDRITRPSVPGGNTASVLSGWASLEVNRDDPTARAELATYPDWTLVRVDVSGQTLWKWNVDCFVGCFPPHAVGDVQLTTNPRGSYFSGWCQTVVGIYFNYSYEIAPTGCVFGSEPTPTDFSWYSVVKGTVEAFRNGAVQ